MGKAYNVIAWKAPMWNVDRCLVGVVVVVVAPSWWSAQPQELRTEQRSHLLRQVIVRVLLTQLNQNKAHKNSTITN